MITALCWQRFIKNLLCCLRWVVCEMIHNISFHSSTMNNVFNQPSCFYLFAGKPSKLVSRSVGQRALIEIKTTIANQINGFKPSEEEIMTWHGRQRLQIITLPWLKREITRPKLLLLFQRGVYIILIRLCRVFA